MLAREQNLEDPMIEAIYGANHEDNLALSDWSVLVRAAEKVGVSGAKEMLQSDWGKQEHAAKVEQYVNMGINAVPVIVINDKYVHPGAPEKSLLHDWFSQLIEKDSITMS